MPTTLNAATQSTLQRSSRKAVELTFQLLVTHFKGREWIGANAYRTNTVDTIKQNTQPGASIHFADLAQYIAASGPVHCADGWGFLGRAVNCLARGDIGTSMHLSYYAELRAAMSLLASSGIGVFDKTHFVIDSVGNCVQVRQEIPTHQFAWLALNHWAGLTQAFDVVVQAIRPNAISLDIWLNAFQPGATTGPIAANWVRTWGLDLQISAEDQKIRNNASYRPSKLDPQSIANPHTSLYFISHIWEVCMPQQGARFGTLDRYILRRSLREVFNGSGLRRPSFSDRVTSMISSLNFTSDSLTINEWQNFLSKKKDRQELILLAEAQKQPTSSPQPPTQMIARAALLLRIATGSCAALIEEASYTSKDLAFWWKSIGKELGIWSPNSIPGIHPGDITDLWDDISDALDHVRPQIGGKTKLGRADLKNDKDMLLSLYVLSECERIAMWGLIP